MTMANDMRLPFVDMMVCIARAWVYCDGGMHEKSITAVEQGLMLCQGIGALPFYRLTLRCAGLWAQVEQRANGSLPMKQSTTLGARILLFKKDSREHGIDQFVIIADLLSSRL